MKLKRVNSLGNTKEHKRDTSYDTNSNTKKASHESIPHLKEHYTASSTTRPKGKNLGMWVFRSLCFWIYSLLAGFGWIQRWKLNKNTYKVNYELKKYLYEDAKEIVKKAWNVTQMKKAA